MTTAIAHSHFSTSAGSVPCLTAASVAKALSLTGIVWSKPGPDRAERILTHLRTIGRLPINRPWQVQETDSDIRAMLDQGVVTVSADRSKTHEQIYLQSKVKLPA